MTDVIPAEIHMISGCEDKQTSADVHDVNSFQLPDPNGRAGGACTSALLKVLYNNKSQGLSWRDVLMEMRQVLSSGGFSQIPQLSSSRKLDVSQDFYIVPPKCQGTKRALLIGINYVGQQGELSGCHNDVNNMWDYLVDELGFKEKHIGVLMDDGQNFEPTYNNIVGAFKELVSACKNGDAVYFHYSGHGGKVRDTSGDESDGFDETLIPVDYKESGQIHDDILYKKLVGALKSGVNLTAVMDCCHSGTVLDLPFKFKADGVSSDMHLDSSTDLGHLEYYNLELAQQRRWILPFCGLVIFAAAIATALYFVLRS